VWKINDVVEEEAGGIKYMHFAMMPKISDCLAKCLMPKNQIEGFFVHHVEAVSGLDLSSDGTLLYSVSQDSMFKI